MKQCIHWMISNIDQLHFDYSSFTIRLANAQWELEIWTFIQNADSFSDLQMEWIEIGLSPTNKHNTNFFYMPFPILFLTGIIDWLLPCLVIVFLHEYALHLLKYCDQRFGKHLKFHHFLLNMIMSHRSHGTFSS